MSLQMPFLFKLPHWNTPNIHQYLNPSYDEELINLQFSLKPDILCAGRPTIQSIYSTPYAGFFLYSHISPSPQPGPKRVPKFKPTFCSIFLQTLTNFIPTCWSFFSSLLLKNILSTFCHSKDFFLTLLLVPTGMKSNKKSKRSIGLPSGFVTQTNNTAKTVNAIG